MTYKEDYDDLMSVRVRLMYENGQVKCAVYAVNLIESRLSISQN